MANIYPQKCDFFLRNKKIRPKNDNLLIYYTNWAYCIVMKSGLWLKKNHGYNDLDNDKNKNDGYNELKSKNSLYPSTDGYNERRL